MSSAEQSPRVAGPEDVDDVVRILVGAFAEDPAWSWAFPDASQRSAQHAQLWRHLVRGAMRYRSVWLTEGGAATSVWIPPGGSELTLPGDVAVAPNGTVYVTNQSVFSGGGQVVTVAH